MFGANFSNTLLPLQELALPYFGISYHPLKSSKLEAF
jgi:hypothetical protein